MTNNFMSQNNTIPWSKDYFLGWLDFQAESNPAVFEDVHSTIKYRYTWTVNSDSIGNQIRFFFHHAHYNNQMIEERQITATNNFHLLIIDVVFDVQQVVHHPNFHHIENYIFQLCLFF